MNGSAHSNPGDVLHITREDALSPHVDDLLKRQASLRGETGITANRRRKWYYSNWFVFGMAGLIGAVAAAGAIEPHFFDLLYVQGAVTAIDALPPAMKNVPAEKGEVMLTEGQRPTAIVTVHGERLFLLNGTRWFDRDGSRGEVSLDDIHLGDELAFHVQHFAEGEVAANLVLFVEHNPPPETRTTQSIDQLNAAHTAVSLMLFPCVAAAVGLLIGAADGMMCRLWRRLFLAGAIGMLIGFLGGFVSQFVAGLVYLPLNRLALQQGGGLGEFTTLGLLTQVTGRGLAWCLAGMAMGLGQGIALRSGRLLLYGFLGGAIGGLLGGILFDPLDLLLLGTHKPSAHLSRLIGTGVIGLVVGVMIGVVELLARDAWLRMLQGPLAGKEFLIFKDLVLVGSSPRSEIYLFNDSEVAERHATIRAAADQYELEAANPSLFPLLVNGRPTTRARLRHGDQITLGSTVFTFQRRRSD